MKWYAIPIRYDLWFVFVLAGLGWALIGGVYVYFAESYLVFEEQRISEKPETIMVILAGDQLRPKADQSFDCPSVTELSEPSNGRTEGRTADLALAFPDGLSSPQLTELAVEGNTFRLTGYRYEDHRKNIFTGEIQDAPSFLPRRFDVIAWEVVAPYGVQGSEGGSDEPAILEFQTAPVRHQAEQDNTSSDLFAFPDSLPCPARSGSW